MLVYKFYPPEYAWESLLKLRFKVSPIDELNDPFEYLSLNVGETSVRAWAAKVRKEVSENNGIISFSRSWREPLMWAHYAQSHTGMALGFEIPDRLLTCIDYIADRIDVPLDVGTNKEEMRRVVDLLLKSKHENWQYEEEVRLVRELSNCVKEGSLYFADWNHVTPLKEVVLGDRYQSKNLTDVQSVLEESGVVVITARPEFKGFKMTRQKDKRLQKRL